MPKLYKEFTERLQTIADINYATGLLHWDMETYMPEKAAQRRSGQISTLSSLAHKKFCSSKTAKLLKACRKSKHISDDHMINIERCLEDYDKAVKLPAKFVAELSETTSKAYMAWIDARRNDDFSLFNDPLQKLIGLKKKETELMGYKEHPYDALLDNFEPKCTVAILDKLFEEVRRDLVPFVANIRNKTQVDNSFLHRFYSKDKQWEFGLHILKEMGYDFKAGRQDISEHPFTINFGSEDVRVTTRVDENNFANMTWSCIHEGGHALYEQGLPAKEYGLPLGSAASLAIHESQSRLWENMVGRSKDFWTANYPHLQSIFPENLSDISLDQFYAGINKVEASPIRTESDELHYHFHVMIRYEIEKGIFDETLKVSDLKEYWNAKYKDYLGLDIKSDKEGILQDIHWAHGSFGYFPTYSLGSFYAAQFYKKVNEDIPSLHNEIKEGNYQSLLNWLRSNIHMAGRKYFPNDLCKEVTAKDLDFKYFMDYATIKYGDIYK